MATEQETGKAGGTAATPNNAKTPDSPEKKMGRKKLLSASNASAYVLLTVGAVVLINLIGTRVFGRVDLTENHVYTLAPGSKQIVEKLPDYLTVKAFISPDLPDKITPLGRYVRDLVDEYRSASNGKLKCFPDRHTILRRIAGQGGGDSYFDLGRAGDRANQKRSNDHQYSSLYFHEAHLLQIL